MQEAIASSASIGKGCEIGHYAVIEEEVSIGRDCRIGHHVVIHSGSRIGNGVRIDDFSVVGKAPLRARRSIFKEEDALPPAVIGDECLVGAHAVIYAGCELGRGVLVADNAAVRENVKIGELTIIGRNVTVENLTTIGKRCKLETNCYITAYSSVGDYCFIAPGVHTTNDNFLGRTEERFKHFKGVIIKNGGRIGGGALILPGVEIGEDSVVAAGSVVTRNVPPGVIVLGAPAKYFRDVPEEQLLRNQGWEE